jgi:hypothetical protein
MAKTPTAAAAGKSKTPVSSATRGQRFAATAKSAGKKAAVLVGDLNKDGHVDREDAKIAGAHARRVAAKVAKGAGTMAEAAAKHDMVKDAAAGAAIGAAVGIPVPIIGPAAGAAVGAIVGVARNLRSAAKPQPEATAEQSKSSTIKSALRGIRKPRQSAAPTPTAKAPKT